MVGKVTTSPSRTSNEPRCSGQCSVHPSSRPSDERRRHVRTAVVGRHQAVGAVRQQQVQIAAADAGHRSGRQLRQRQGGFEGCVGRTGSLQLRREGQEVGEGHARILPVRVPTSMCGIIRGPSPTPGDVDALRTHDRAPAGLQLPGHPRRGQRGQGRRFRDLLPLRPLLQLPGRRGAARDGLLDHAGRAGARH